MVTMREGVGVVTAILLFACIASAQNSEDRPKAGVSLGPIVPFLESTDVFWSWPALPLTKREFPEGYEPPYMVEASVFPHLIFWQKYSEVLDADSQAQRLRERNDVKEFSFALSGTPGLKLRMLTTASEPVRSPTFTPRATFQVLWTRGLAKSLRAEAAPLRFAASARQRLIHDASGQLLPTQIEPRPDVEAFAFARLRSVSLWESRLRFAHYSNGQEGCLHVGQERENGECQPDLGSGALTLNADTINRANGSFSTNFWAWGVNYMRNTLRPENYGLQTLARYEAVREVRVGAEVEWHVRNAAIAPYYGSWRLHANAGMARRGVPFCKRRLDYSATGTRGWPADDVPKWAGAVQATCFPLVNGGWGYFVRLYAGQDYYNAQFFQSIRRLQFGFTYSQSDFFRFRFPSPS